jgi:hypothetical protein
MSRYLQVQVRFSQGLVKTFVAQSEILMCDFVDAVGAFGKQKSIRFLPDLDRPTADLLVATGNAVMVAAKREVQHA